MGVFSERPPSGILTLRIQTPPEDVRTWGVFGGLSTFSGGIWMSRVRSHMFPLMPCQDSPTGLKEKVFGDLLSPKTSCWRVLVYKV